MLRSIPPINRQSGARLSSMRAATRVGLTFVGRPHCQPGPTDQFQPQVIAPNPQRQQQRQAYLQALRMNITGLEELLKLATEPDEITFWQAALERLKQHD